jgi:uncharacterized protein with NAD-binding domain and iron-sulfur cluster
MTKKKIAVLGGGAGSMAAVYGMTLEPNWAEKYDITVYQLGWRLGGKGASGRDPSPEGRYANVEHGFHLFGGFYHNAFNMLKPLYADWAATPQATPIPWQDAFVEHDLVTLGNSTPEGWGFCSLDWPHLPGEIGVGGTELTVDAVLTAMIAWINHSLDSLLGIKHGELRPDSNVRFNLVEEIELKLVEEFQSAVDVVVRAIEKARDKSIAGELAFDGLVALLNIAIGALKLLDRIIPLSKNDTPWLDLIEVVMVCLKGMIIDDVFDKGFDVSNGKELKTWLTDNGLSAKALGSFMVRSGYDYAFAYSAGDATKPCFAAGVALRGLMRLMLTYHGSIFWHLNGGMGEIVFTPLYQVLKAKGVKFRFFTRVESLGLSADGQTIETIRCKAQAVPKAGIYDYDPLLYYPEIDRKFWPMEPKWDQLIDGATLAPIGAGFEDYWLTPASDKPFNLSKGTDFDTVILGISVAALDTICAELCTRVPAWKPMLAAQQAIPTFGIQYWMKPSVKELGFDVPNPIMTAYEEPIATWADMTFLLEFEKAGPDGSKPKSLAYFCGQMPEPVYPPVPSPGFQAAQVADAKVTMKNWLDKAITTMWPNSGNPAGPGLDPSLVYSTAFKANVSPSERYVLSPPGKIHLRPRADESHVSNLFLAGDWLKTGLDAGAFEAAVMGGLQCAVAITGYKIKVYGETDFPTQRKPD